MLRANETLYHRSVPQKSDGCVAHPVALRFPGEIVFFMKHSKINRLGSLTFSRSYRVVLLLLLFASTALAQTKTLGSAAVPTNSEQRTELGLQAAKRNLLQLRHFLLQAATDRRTHILLFRNGGCRSRSRCRTSHHSHRVQESLDTPDRRRQFNEMVEFRGSFLTQ